MGILDIIRHAFAPTPRRPDDQDAARDEVEGAVAQLSHEREEADATIAGWRKQTEHALQSYVPGRTNLAEALRRARVERGGQP